MLAIPHQEQQMDMMPMGGGMEAQDMGMPMGDPNGDPNMGMPMDAGMGGDPMMGGMPEENYGADFDAGVDADEATDPKKYIQQLTGKLSQSLRKYNQGQPTPDADLGKYVAGMIVKQAIDGLSQDDVTEILDKLKSDEPMDGPSDGQGDEQMPMDSQNQMPDGGMGQNQMMPNGANESIGRFGFNIDELVINDLNKKDVDMQRPIQRSNSFKKKPFTSPSFE